VQSSKSSGDAAVEEKCWTIRRQELDVSIAEANQKGYNILTSGFAWDASLTQ
jgi:hypothetical protein